MLVILVAIYFQAELFFRVIIVVFAVIVDLPIQRDFSVADVLWDQEIAVVA